MSAVTRVVPSTSFGRFSGSVASSAPTTKSSRSEPDEAARTARIPVRPRLARAPAPRRLRRSPRTRWARASAGHRRREQARRAVVALPVYTFISSVSVRRVAVRTRRVGGSPEPLPPVGSAAGTCSCGGRVVDRVHPHPHARRQGRGRPARRPRLRGARARARRRRRRLRARRSRRLHGRSGVRRQLGADPRGADCRQARREGRAAARRRRADELDADAIRTTGAALARRATKSPTVATTLLEATADGVEKAAAAQALAEGVLLGGYQFVEYKSDAKISELSRGRRARTGRSAASRRGSTVA